MNRATAVSTAMHENRRTHRQDRKLSAGLGGPNHPHQKRRKRSLTMAGWKLFLLYVAFLSYVLIGAAIFHAIENHSSYRGTPPPPPPPVVLNLANGSTISIPQPLKNAKGQNIIIWPKLTYIDSIYFILVNLSTIGFGDIIPTCDGSRAFVVCWSFVGVSFLSLVFVQLTLDDVYKRIKRRIKRKWRERNGEITDLEMQSLPHSPGFSEPGSPRAESVAQSVNNSVTSLPSVLALSVSRTNLDSSMKPGSPNMSSSRTNLGDSVWSKSSKSSKGRPSMQSFAMNAADIFAQSLSALVLYIGWLLVGAAIFSHTEKHAKTVNDGAPWTFANALYFCYIASTSIGYGTDYSAVTQKGRLAFILWVQVAIFLQLLLFSNLFNLIWKQLNKGFKKKMAEIVAEEIPSLPPLTAPYTPAPQQPFSDPTNADTAAARKMSRHVHMAQSAGIEDEAVVADVASDRSASEKNESPKKQEEAKSESSSWKSVDDPHDDRPIRAPKHHAEPVSQVSAASEVEKEPSPRASMQVQRGESTPRPSVKLARGKARDF